MKAKRTYKFYKAGSKAIALQDKGKGFRECFQVEAAPMDMSKFNSHNIQFPDGIGGVIDINPHWEPSGDWEVSDLAAYTKVLLPKLSMYLPFATFKATAGGIEIGVSTEYKGSFYIWDRSFHELAKLDGIEYYAIDGGRTLTIGIYPRCRAHNHILITLYSIDNPGPPPSGHGAKACTALEICKALAEGLDKCWKFMDVKFK